jgi:hypothetical protein
LRKNFYRLPFTPPLWSPIWSFNVTHACMAILWHKILILPLHATHGVGQPWRLPAKHGVGQPRAIACSALPSFLHQIPRSRMRYNFILHQKSRLG